MWVHHNGNGMELCDVCECIITTDANPRLNKMITITECEIQVISYKNEIYIFCSEECHNRFKEAIKHPQEIEDSEDDD